MATNYGSKDIAFFLVGGRDVLASIGSMEDNREAKLAETTPCGPEGEFPRFGDTGARMGTITQDGWFDTTADQANAALCDREGTNQVLCLAKCGNVIGRKMLAAFGAFASKYGRILSVNDLHKAKAEHSITGGLYDAAILKTHAAVTGDGNTQATSVDNAAASLTGGVAVVQCSALSLGGYTDLTVKVRHSADNNTFVDLATFTAVTSAPGAEAKTVAGTVNRYLAASWAFTGSGGAHSATFTVGFART